MTTSNKNLYSTLKIVGAIAGIIIILYLLSYYLDSETQQPTTEYTDKQVVVSSEPSTATNLAGCLTEKGLVMYGTEWCGYCKKQKSLFGDSFTDVNYVDCEKDRSKCVEAGVQGFPTWVINGQLRPGVHSLEELASLSGCSLN